MFKIAKNIAVVLVAAVILTSTSVPAPALAASSVPARFDLKSGTLFNTPAAAGGTAAQQYVFHRTVSRAVNATPAGAIVAISMYSMEIESAADTLIAAHKRGVHIQLLIWNERATTTQFRALQTELGSDPAKSSFIVACTGSCRLSGTAGIQHAKGITISRIIGTNGADIPYISFVGSANFSVGNAVNSWNNTEVIVKNKAVYDSLRSYIIKMRFDKTLYNHPTLNTTKYGLYYYPTTKGTDPILSALNQTTCKAPTGYGASGKTRVWVAMYAWTTRRDEIAKRMIALHKAGCNVAVIYTSDPAAPPSPIAEMFVNAKVPIKDGRNDLNGNGVNDVYMHAKTTIIDGMVGGRGRSLVYGGSANFTENSITDNTEIIIRIDDKAAVSRHVASFGTWWKYGRRITSISQLSEPQPAAVVDDSTVAGSRL